MESTILNGTAFAIHSRWSARKHGAGTGTGHGRKDGNGT